MRVEDKINSAHQPVEVIIKGKKEKEKSNEGKKRFWRRIWGKKRKEQLRDKLGNVENRREEIKIRRKK